jgi:hypothetical protein
LAIEKRIANLSKGDTFERAKATIEIKNAVNALNAKINGEAFAEAVAPLYKPIISERVNEGRRDA